MKIIRKPLKIAKTIVVFPFALVGAIVIIAAFSARLTGFVSRDD